MKGRDRPVLDKQELLRGKKNFEYLFQEGRKYRTPYVVFAYAENGLTYNRIAPVVSKRFGDSVFRNHNRRVIKEIYRNAKTDIKTGYDICIVLNDRRFNERSFPEKRDMVMAGLMRITGRTR